MNRFKMKKVRISSWLFAACFLLAGAGSFSILPRFQIIYRDLYAAGGSLPDLTKFVLVITPVGWLLLACIMAVLLILRDVRGKAALLPNWAALIMLLATGFFVVIALFLPLVSDLAMVEAR